MPFNGLTDQVLSEQDIQDIQAAYPGTTREQIIKNSSNPEYVKSVKAMIRASKKYGVTGEGNYANQPSTEDLSPLGKSVEPKPWSPDEDIQKSISPKPWEPDQEMMVKKQAPSKEVAPDISSVTASDVETPDSTSDFGEGDYLSELKRRMYEDRLASSAEDASQAELGAGIRSQQAENTYLGQLSKALGTLGMAKGESPMVDIAEASNKRLQGVLDKKKEKPDRYYEDLLLKYKGAQIGKREQRDWQSKEKEMDRENALKIAQMRGAVGGESRGMTAGQEFYADEKMSKKEEPAKETELYLNEIKSIQPELFDPSKQITGIKGYEDAERLPILGSHLRDEMGQRNYTAIQALITKARRQEFGQTLSQGERRAMTEYTGMDLFADPKALRSFLILVDKANQKKLAVFSEQRKRHGIDYGDGTQSEGQLSGSVGRVKFSTLPDEKKQEILNWMKSNGKSKQEAREYFGVE